MNNNLRPFLVFIGIVVLIGAAFWGVLAFASGYNNRLATPAPTTEAATESNQTNPQSDVEKHPHEPEAKAPSAPQPVTSTPKAEETPLEAAKSQPTKPAPKPLVVAGTVPATGPGDNLLLTSIFVGITTFLVLVWRGQSVRLRTTR